MVPRSVCLPSPWTTPPWLSSPRSRFRRRSSTSVCWTFKICPSSLRSAITVRLRCMGPYSQGGLFQSLAVRWSRLLLEMMEQGRVGVVMLCSYGLVHDRYNLLFVPVTFSSYISPVLALRCISPAVSLPYYLSRTISLVLSPLYTLFSPSRAQLACLCCCGVSLPSICPLYYYYQCNFEF